MKTVIECLHELDKAIDSLSDKELLDLISKFNLSEDEAKQYAFLETVVLAKVIPCL